MAFMTFVIFIAQNLNFYLLVYTYFNTLSYVVCFLFFLLFLRALEPFNICQVFWFLSSHAYHHEQPQKAKSWKAKSKRGVGNI